MEKTIASGYPQTNHPMLLQAVLDTFHSGIHIFNAIRDQNGAIIDFQFILLGKESIAFRGRQDLPGKKLLEEYPDYRTQLEQMAQVVNSGQARTHEVHLSGNGKNSWYLVTDSPFGEGLVNVWEDITEQKQAEEKIRELNRTLLINNRELASVNSELKTFNSIAATDYTDTLRKLYTNLEFIIAHDARNLTDEGKANVRRAQSAIQKMKLLTEDIVSYSRIHTHDTDLQRVDLVTMLQAIQDDMRRNWPDININIDCQENMPAIEGYPFLLNLLFHHLIDNAIKFRKENIHPVVKVSCRDYDAASVKHPAAIPGTRYNRYTFTDQGIGFEQTSAEDIFLIFHRLHQKGMYKGSGIGLAICRKIMDIHGGFIIAESTPGDGAHFHCYFPVP
jgi:signal transduction histidine kinase